MTESVEAILARRVGDMGQAYRDAIDAKIETHRQERADDGGRALVTVPDTPDVYMSVSARNYAEADDAFWHLRQRLSDLGREPSIDELAHLGVLRQRRKDAYADLRAWFIACEAKRLDVDVRRVAIRVEEATA